MTKTQDVLKAIKTLYQGTRTSNEYITDFKLLAAKLRDPARDYIHHHFLHSLDSKLAKSIINDLQESDTLEEIYSKTLQKASIMELVQALHITDGHASIGSQSLKNATSKPRCYLNRRSTQYQQPFRSGGGVLRQDGKKFWPRLTDKEQELLDKNERCYAYRRIKARHMSYNCPDWKRGRTSKGHVKKEEVSIVDGYVVCRDISPSESDTETNAYSSVSVITVPTHIQEARVDSGVDSGATINVISPCVVKKYKLIERPALLIKICQTLDPKDSTHNTKVVSKVTLLAELWASLYEHEFTIAPLSNHDMLFGIPFLAKKDILIDLANHSLVLSNNNPVTAHSSIQGSPTTC